MNIVRSRFKLLPRHDSPQDTVVSARRLVPALRSPPPAPSLPQSLPFGPSSRSFQSIVSGRMVDIMYKPERGCGSCSG